MSDPTPKVFAAINAVAGELATVGIAKSRKNQKQGYNYRGIDQVYDHLGPLLAKHKLVILPQAEERIEKTVKSKADNDLNYVTLKVRFMFISAEDGSSFPVVQYAEGMDSADKATNKASSAAYKYAVIQAFAIPVEGTPDADAETPTDDLQPRAPPEVEKIRAEIKAAGKNEAKVLAYFELDDLAKITDKQLAKLRDMLKPKEGKGAGADTGKG